MAVHFAVLAEVSRRSNKVGCKPRRIEVYLITESGLVSALEIPIYGRIKTVNIIHCESNPQDFLLITTHKFGICIIGYNAERDCIYTRASGSLEDRGANLSECGPIVVLDPRGHIAGMHIYAGLFKVISLDPPELSKLAYNLRLEELKVLDIKFLYGMPRPTIALLFQDQLELRHIKTMEIEMHSNIPEFAEGPWKLRNVESGAHLLIPIPKPLLGIVVIGIESIIYHNEPATKSLRMKPAEIRSWSNIDANYSRILLADTQGRLWLLALINDGTQVLELKLEWLADTSIPSAVQYLDNQVVFIGSESGDSQLILLQKEKNPETQSYAQILETYTNIAPIIDFEAVPRMSHGNMELITCSGCFKDGSLRIVRNGIGISEHAMIEQFGILGIWSFTSFYTLEKGDIEKYLVISYLKETRLLSISGEILEEFKLAGFENNQQTLQIGLMSFRNNAVINCNLPRNELNTHYDQQFVAINNDYPMEVDTTNLVHYLVQVTMHQIIVLNLETNTRSDVWSPPDGVLINLCSISYNKVAVTLGSKLFVFRISPSGQISTPVSTSFPHEISCLTVSSFSRELSNYVIVVLWKDVTVEILRFDDLLGLYRESLDSDVIARSVLLTCFDSIYHLFVGLGDGQLIDYTFDFSLGDFEGGRVVLGSMKRILMGTYPIYLSQFYTRNSPNVFVCGDKPTVIYGRNKKVLYSNVNVNKVSCICELNSPSFPDSLVMVSNFGLLIGTVDEIQKMHVFTYPLDEGPLRIQYQVSSGTFLVSTLRLEYDSAGREKEHGLVRLISDHTHEVLDIFALSPYEMGTAVTCLAFAPHETDFYYVLGTAIAVPSEPDSTRARLLVFTVSSDRKLVLKLETDVPGTVNVLKPFHGKILAAIGSRVCLYGWSDAPEVELRLECQHGNFSHVDALDVCGEKILVGDMYRSVSLLRYKPVDSRLELVAMNTESRWISNVFFLDEDYYLGTDTYLNLLVWKCVEGSQPYQRLELVGQYHLGESINAIKKGVLTLKTNNDADNTNFPTAIYVTTEGSIGILATLPKDLFNELLELQNNVTKVFKGVGGFLHSDWRNFKNDYRTIEFEGFIDGDFLESILELDKVEQQKIASAIGMDCETLVQKIELVSTATH